VLLGDLIERVVSDTGQPKAVVETVLRSALAQIEEAVGKGETVNLVGFGRFEVHERSARPGRNLQTGERLKIPATRVVRFKIGKHLRDAAARSKRKRTGKGEK
jgi:DNA-binding protein HU-beta